MAKAKGVRMTGVQFKEFWNDNWDGDPDAFVEEEVISINGEEVDDPDLDAIADTDLVVILGGVAVINREDKPITEVARRWLKVQTTRNVIIEVAADDVDKLIEAVNATGITVKIVVAGEYDALKAKLSAPAVCGEDPLPSRPTTKQ